jgi:uncharacterized membrane protein (DUF441 family)
MVLAMMPVFQATLGIKLTYFTILLPFVNCNIVLRQFMDSSVEWFYWLILLFTTIVYTWIAIQYAIRLMKNDAMLTPP